MRRIPHRRLLVVLTAAAALAAGVAAVTPRLSPPVAVAGAEPAAAPQIVRRSARPDRRPCRLDRVDAVDWIVQSAPWGLSTGFALRPNDGERCTLSGRPQLSGIDTATGRSEFIAAADLGPLDTGVTRQFPATIDPGEPARIQIRGNTACPPGRTPRSYRNLALTVGGKKLSLPAARRLTAVCGADVSPWFVEPPMDYAALNATVEAPATLRPGQDFSYRVRIDNVFPRDYPLPSCPVFRLDVGAADTGSWQRLRCTGKRLGGRDNVQFTLDGRIPPGIEPGRHRLTWMAVMGNGEALIADMATDGTPVTITGR